MDLLRSIQSQGRTVILVTHDAATADYAEREVLLHDGLVQDH